MAETDKGRATRQRLLQAASYELARAGDVELASIAKRAGVSPGLPYRYFDSKADLLAKVADDFFERFEQAIMRPRLADASDDWWEREQLRIRRMVTFFYDEPLSERVIARMGDRIPHQARAAAKNLRHGQRLGAVGAEVDCDLAASFIMAGVFQCVSTALAARPRHSKRRLARTLVRLVGNVVEIE